MDTTLQYLPTLIVGFAASLGLTPISRQIAMRLGVVDKPTLARKIHTDHKPMMGGLAIYVAFALTLMLFSPSAYVPRLLAIIGASGILAVTGLLDDRFNLGVRVRLIAMALASLVVIGAGVQIRLFNSPVVDIPITLIWLVALTNSLNFLDNMDGLSAGISTIAALFFLLIGLSQGQMLVILLSAALLGSAIGFLTYNFNPASTFMGDMGALVLGFVLAVLAIELNFATQPLSVTWMIPILVLAVPITDINLVVWTRLSEKRSPWEGGKDHTSHRLMSLGLNQRQTLLVIYGLCVVFGAIGLVVSAAPTALAWQVGAISLGLLGLWVLWMIWLRRRFQKGA